MCYILSSHDFDDASQFNLLGMRGKFDGQRAPRVSLLRSSLSSFRDENMGGTSDANNHSSSCDMTDYQKSFSMSVCNQSPVSGLPGSQSYSQESTLMFVQIR
ncbi:hypothetical protein ACS0TY_016926 [Phlomoides rotata]